MQEEWRPVVGYEGWYEVSSLGRVRRVGAATGARVGRILLPRLHPVRGYYQVFLSRDAAVQTFDVHRLVAAAFLGPRPEGCQIHHRSSNSLDNRAVNLAYMPATEHRGTIRRPCGDRHYGVRLSSVQVEKIRALHPDPRSTVGATATARLLGVSRGAVTGVITGKNWGGG